MEDEIKEKCQNSILQKENIYLTDDVTCPVKSKE